jgi:hypothetical protein
MRQAPFIRSTWLPLLPLSMPDNMKAAVPKVMFCDLMMTVLREEV